MNRLVKRLYIKNQRQIRVFATIFRIKNVFIFIIAFGGIFRVQMTLFYFFFTDVLITSWLIC